MYYIFLLTSFSLPFSELSLMRMIGPAFSAMTLRRRNSTQLHSTSSWVELCRYKRAFTFGIQQEGPQPAQAPPRCTKI